MSETKDINLQAHWDAAYERTSTDKTGWYEEFPEQSLNLIEDCKVSKDARIFNAGAGSTTLVDHLLKRGYNNLIASDISSSALSDLKERLGDEGKNIEWIVDDLTAPGNLNQMQPVDVWHDRAVVHFFTDENDRKTYFELLNRSVKSGGYAIIATFNLEGAEKCCGLPVYRFDASMLKDHIGDDFSLVNHFNYTYTQPSGNTREYVYTLFKKK